MSKSSKKRRLYRYYLEYEYPICFLSGEPIIRLDDITKEHYCPKSRVPMTVWNHPYNIKPAIKIINSIKGNLLPCEWYECREQACKYALENYKIDDYERDLLKRCIFKFKKDKNKNPCQECVLNLLNQCEKIR